MTVFQEEIRLKPTKELEMVDVTPDVRKVVRNSGLSKGMVNVFVPGSTGALITIEHEPGLQKDFPKFLERIVPTDIYYHHHETWNDGNGHSHVRASLLGPSMTVPFSNGQLLLGTWQQIVFVELDIRTRNRRLIVTVYGE